MVTINNVVQSLEKGSAKIHVIGHWGLPDTRIVFRIEEVDNPKHLKLIGEEYHAVGAFTYHIPPTNWVNYNAKLLEEKLTINIIGSGGKIELWAGVSLVTQEDRNTHTQNMARQRESDQLLWDYNARQNKWFK